MGTVRHDHAAGDHRALLALSVETAAAAGGHLPGQAAVHAGPSIRSGRGVLAAAGVLAGAALPRRPHRADVAADDGTKAAVSGTAGTGRAVAEGESIDPQGAGTHPRQLASVGRSSGGEGAA